MNRSLTIVADAHIWGVESAFSELPGFEIDLRILENRDITHSAVKDADILLTRSSTKVNAALLRDTSVRFAGTATIGDDHYDKSWLKEHGIAFANAAGSSTGSVIEYMLTVLLKLHGQGLISIPDTTIGIIGVGRIGQALEKRCRALGMQVLLNDPPRQRHEGVRGLSSLDTLLEKADILSLHTPLIREGQDCTVHLLGREQMQQFRGNGMINTARGSCLDNQALCDWLNDHPAHFAALDCWEHESEVSSRLLAHHQTAIATPHIAGHSLDGKAANTQLVYQALCGWLDITPCWDMEKHLPASSECIHIRCGSDPFTNILAATGVLYPIQKDHGAMKSWAQFDKPALATAFARYRRHYPVRRAWQYVPIHFDGAQASTLQLAHAINITTA